FADYIEEGSWVEARVDTAIPDRSPAPKPDIRKKLVALGPVVVFGAANFPLAYSTAGGDTASALAAGCPVIVKAHPAHAKTSELVAGAIKKAMKTTGMPAGVFQHLHGAGFEVGQALVKHPRTSAVGFTGSFVGGKALFDLANQRPTPIPVFAEMSSINPVILLPDTLKKDFE
ncbi:MAG: aldehyde dehydrogenase family protein, partial [Pseudomonadales bacterium]